MPVVFSLTIQGWAFKAEQALTIAMSKNKSLFDGFNSLGELGEFGLIERIGRLFGRDFEPEATGIGDDCAVLSCSGERLLLVTTDMLIEGQHFHREWTPARDLGYKSLGVNLSDISAMGGRPAFAFLSIGLPDDLPLDWLEHYLRGMHKLAGKHDVKLLGGDTTKSPDTLVVNYTVLGFAQPDKILMRSGAKPGDRIGLLGSPGESGAGLKLLMEYGPTGNEQKRYRRLIEAHNRPRLFIEEAQFLAGFPGVHAMIDLSDGLHSDATHIAVRSGATLRIDIEKLPVTPLLRKSCEELSWPLHELALTAGEDYGLLFTLDGLQAEKICKKFNETFGYEFTTVGEVTEGAPELHLEAQGKPFKMDKTGFDHFKTV